MLGRKFGEVIVTEEAESRYGNRKFWKYRCSCGNSGVAAGTDLRIGRVTSCGKCNKHGKWGSKIYRIYHDMRKRCEEPTANNYSRYGARGISVEWNSFEEFYADMGDPPRGMQLDRIDSNGNYCKKNCKWSTIEEQNRNRRDNVWLEAEGRSMILEDWLKELGISRSFYYKRKKEGMPFDAIVAIARIKNGMA